MRTRTVLAAVLSGAVVTVPAAALQPPTPTLAGDRGARLGRGGTHETDHLTIRTSASDRAITPGGRLTLLVDVVPKPRMHVYAPEQTDYIPVALTIGPDDAFKVHTAVFSKAEKFFFKPLNETQLVYSKPFRIVQDITIAATPALRERARTTDATITIAGKLRYQACDDAVCYRPESVPVEWTISLTPARR